MLVFFGPFTRFFALFKNVQNRKKSEKCPKNRIFQSFSLCSAAFFPTFLHYAKCLYFLHFVPQNKNLKKPEKKLLKLFWRIKIWTIIFVHISKFKKSFKKIKRFSVFFQSPKIAFLVFQIWKCLFLEDVLEYFAITGSKKNERICYLFAHAK